MEWNVGEAAGAQAAFCIAHSLASRQVRTDAALLGEFQEHLRSEGVKIRWPEPMRTPR